MRVRTWRIVAAACALAAQAGAGSANDSTATIGAGGLVLTVNAGVAMKSEDLRIGADQIDVAYEFVNQTGADVTTLVAFPMPRLAAIDSETIESLPKGDDPVDFVGFSVSVDGKAIRPDVEQRASILGLDITDRLKADGVPVNPFPHQQGRDALSKLPKDKRAYYLTHGLAQWSEGQPISVQWDVSTIYYWLQTFPAGKTVKVAHRYTPVAGAMLLKTADIGGPPAPGSLRARFCVADAVALQYEKAVKYGAKDEAPLLGRRVDYVLKTGANWAGPIASFRLTVAKPKSGALVSFCGPGLGIVETPTEISFAAKDFVPKDDLSILFVSGPEKP